VKAATLDALLTLRADKTPGVLVTDLASGAQALLRDDGIEGALDLDAEGEAAAHAALREDRSRTVEIGGKQLFFQVYNPPLRLFVVGAVHISQALAPMAAMLGYDVTRASPSPPRRASPTSP
jgi:xanthine dehydrogenase accessory factor